MDEKTKKKRIELKPLDELFRQASEYKKSRNFRELIDFMAKFPNIAPYNVMLMHVQKPYCKYVASALDWKKNFGRTIKPGARPIIILKPFRPVDFLFDLSDTDGDDELLPDDISVKLNKVKGKINSFTYRMLIDNLPNDGIRYQERELASTLGGFITRNDNGYIQHSRNYELKFYFDMVVSSNSTIEENFSVIVHELGHLYCGHLGNFEGANWLNRIKETELYSKEKSHALCEFEAECTSWLVCERMNLHNSAAGYLSTYLDENDKIPPISLEAIIKSVDRIESMIKKIKLPLKELIVNKKNNKLF